MIATAIGRALRRPHGPLTEQLAFLVAFALAGMLGRLTIVDGITVGLIWPAVGVAVVWCSVSLRRGRRWVLVATVLVLAGALLVSRATGVPLAPTVVFGIANLVTLATAVGGLHTRLFARSGLLTEEAYDALSTVRGVLALAGIAATAAAAGSLVGVLAMLAFVPSIPVTPLSVVLWWGRNVTGIVSVVAFAVLLAAAVRHRRTGPPGATAPRRTVLDGLDEALARDTAPPPATRLLTQHRLLVGVLFVATAVAYSVDLMHGQGPTAYPLLAFTIWSGLLCSSLVTVLHTALSTVLVVLWTVLGRGPFGNLESPRVMAAEVQLYVAFILFLGLLLAAARSEIRASLAKAATAEKSAAARAELLVAVSEAMNDGLLVVAPSGRILAGNRAAAELLRVDREVVTHRDQITMLRPDGTPIPPEAHPSVLALHDGDAPAQDVLVIGDDGVPRTLAVRATRLDDAGDGAARRTPASSAVAVVFTDVTDERAQRDYLAGFAGMVAHDLRSPLSTVLGWLDMASLMTESDPTASAHSLAQPLARASAGAVQMGRLIDDLMTHVSAHGQVLELEPIDLARLVHEVADAHGVGDALVVRSRPEVWGDRALVHQLVTNLVGNAAKYRHPDRPLSLALHAVTEHGVVTVVLEDNGAGIPEADRDKVFERFFRVEEHRALASGTGLGLAMCRTIVERHGGTIRALPRPGRPGAAIEVTLAAVPPLGADRSVRPELVAAPRHLRPVRD